MKWFHLVGRGGQGWPHKENCITFWHSRPKYPNAVAGHAQLMTEAKPQLIRDAKLNHKLAKQEKQDLDTVREGVGTYTHQGYFSF